MSKTGILLINLGTPDAPDPRSVGRYLKQFLLDPRVITLPAPLRWLLVRCIIVPFRSKKSSEAYESIWQEEGSPLLINSQNFAENLERHYTVALGMRYGKPSIADAVHELGEMDKIIVLPMFPQYSEAATGSAIAEAMRVILRKKKTPETIVIKDFYNDQNYIDAMANSIRPYLRQDYDFILSSYHGLPERQAGNYRDHCFKTSELIAKTLELPSERWGVSFQSRLGKLPWIKPYTDQVLPVLYEKGVRKLLICCPSFVADCLETLEEIGMQAKEQWLNLGGTDFTLIPCLNEQSDWIRPIIDKKGFYTAS